MKRLLLALVVLPAVLHAQSLRGYWVGREVGVNTQTGQHVVRIGIIRFDATQFTSILKEDDGSDQLATLPLVHGQWEIGQAFGHPVLCATPDYSAFAGSCQSFEISADGQDLHWGPVILMRTDSTKVDGVAPELTRGVETHYDITPQDDSLLSVPRPERSATDLSHPS